MNKIFLLGLTILMIVLNAACSKQESNQQNNVELTISAAASLSDALTEIKKSFETEHPSITILYNIGGSGALKQQILQGAPADLFLSASNDHFLELSNKGFIMEDEQVNLLSNQLVLITNKQTPANIIKMEDLTSDDVSKIAIGIPDSVPAGMYAKQTLQNLGLWEEVTPKLVQTKDVKQVLTYVETGNIDAGLVYKTDASASNKIKMILTADEQYHDKIIYPAGIIKSSKNKNEAILFLDYLQSSPAIQIFEKYGFTVLD
nr:molybdate ABC transporter substrate-binding protein [Neobacillus sp. Marseille-Q6967]